MGSGRARLALDLLQPVREVEEGWVGGSILVVGEHQASIIMHALANKAAKNQTNI